MSDLTLDVFVQHMMRDASRLCKALEQAGLLLGIAEPGVIQPRTYLRGRPDFVATVGGRLYLYEDEAEELFAYLANLPPEDEANKPLLRDLDELTRQRDEIDHKILEVQSRMSRNVS